MLLSAIVVGDMVFMSTSWATDLGVNADEVRVDVEVPGEDVEEQVVDELNFSALIQRSSWLNWTQQEITLPSSTGRSSPTCRTTTSKQHQRDQWSTPRKLLVLLVVPLRCPDAPMFLRFYDAAVCQQRSDHLHPPSCSVGSATSMRNQDDQLVGSTYYMQSGSISEECSTPRKLLVLLVVPIRSPTDWRTPTTIGSPSTAKKSSREWFQGDDMACRMNELSNGIQPGKELVN
uniref:Uncharacterized protein n=1 Tax=Caenorhabditis japonica TaxID=281687 RepID=A0A8R1IH99_CAEJA